MNTSKQLREELIAEYQITFRFFEIHPDDKNGHCRLFSCMEAMVRQQIYRTFDFKHKKNQPQRDWFFLFYLKLNFTVNMTWLGRSKTLVYVIFVVLMS